VDPEATPEAASLAFAECLDQGLLGVRVQVVQNEVNAGSAWIGVGNAFDRMGEPVALSVLGRVSEVLAGEHLNDAEDVGRLLS
jgi:hypothetical protein